MERIWAAEIVVDVEHASALIGEQFPALRPVTAATLGAGWDNTVFRVNERYVFRFPRREIAVDLIETELRCLPILAQRLVPVSIPVPLYAGRPSTSYPWPFAGYTYISGTRALRGAADLPWRVNLADALGRFLRALHSISPRDLPDGAVPPDTLARLDCRRRRQSTEARLKALESAGIDVDAPRILTLIDSAPVDEASWRLARARAAWHAVMLLVSSLDVGDRQLAAEARIALSFIMDGDDG